MRFDSRCILVSVLATANAFVAPTHTRQHQRIETWRHQVLYDDFEDFFFDEPKQNKANERSNKSSNTDSELYASLFARQADLESTQISPFSAQVDAQIDESLQESMENWKGADCVSTVRLTLKDWIRRMAIDSYPLAVCGTAGGHLVLADLQAGEELDSLQCVHAARSIDGQVVMQRKQDGAEDDDSSTSDDQDKQAFFASLPEELPEHMEEAINTLYGQYDGGGIVALAMKDDWIVSSGREGGVHLCRIQGDEQDVYKGSRGGTSRQTKLRLERLGKFRGLEEDAVVITSLVFDTLGSLWVGGFDGILRAYDFEEIDSDDHPLMLRQRKPLFQVNIGSPILNLSVNEELGVGVASTLHRGIVLFSLEDGELLGKWNPFVKKIRKEFVRSAMVLKDTSSGREATWSVVCGGSKGGLFQRQLSVDRTGCLAESRPFLDQNPTNDAVFPIKMRPNHMGAIVALASPFPGLLVSGSLDGSMRVWDYSAVKGETEEEDLDDEDEEEDVELEAQYDDVDSQESRPQCLYALSGYKVWLGSIFASPQKLVSDGADNTIIVHSFEDEEEVLFSEEDDEEEFEGFL